MMGFTGRQRAGKWFAQARRQCPTMMVRHPPLFLPERGRASGSSPDRSLGQGFFWEHVFKGEAMSTQHTPGPWSSGVSLWKGREVFTAVEAANPQRITAVCGVTGAPDEAESIANAQLIAAAPDHHAVALELNRLMLVIETAVRHQDPSHRAAVVAMLKANRAAIAKATGAA